VTVQNRVVHGARRVERTGAQFVVQGARQVFVLARFVVNRSLSENPVCAVADTGFWAVFG
jgi:hypothetical protein